MMKIICDLKAMLLEQQIVLNVPVTLYDLMGFEYKYQLKLSPILTSYFLRFNGSGESNFADDGFSFFGLHEFKPLTEFIGYKNQGKDYSSYFVFSDYLVWCWGYAVKLDKSGYDGAIYKVTDATAPIYKISDSFLDFLIQYQENSDNLL